MVAAHLQQRVNSTIREQGNVCELHPEFFLLEVREADAFMRVVHVCECACVCACVCLFARAYVCVC